MTIDPRFGKYPYPIHTSESTQEFNAFLADIDERIDNIDRTHKAHMQELDNMMTEDDDVIPNKRFRHDQYDTDILSCSTHNTDSTHMNDRPSTSTTLKEVTYAQLEDELYQRRDDVCRIVQEPDDETTPAISIIRNKDGSTIITSSTLDRNVRWSDVLTPNNITPNVIYQ